MSCPFLSGRQIKVCGAFQATMVLDVEELDRVCQNNAYATCKLYKKRLAQNEHLPLHEYRRDQILSVT